MKRQLGHARIMRSHEAAGGDPEAQPGQGVTRGAASPFCTSGQAASGMNVERRRMSRGLFLSRYDGAMPMTRIGPTLAEMVVVLATIAVVPAVLILWWRDRSRLRRRYRLGLCTACGYDRSGLAADAACPECGKVPWT